MNTRDPFEILFARKGIIQRHRETPFALERRRFLNRLLRRGRTVSHVRQVAFLLRRAAEAFRGKALRQVTHIDLDTALVRIWGRMPARHSPFRGSCTAYCFRAVVSQWLVSERCTDFRRRRCKGLSARLRLYQEHLKGRHLAECTTETNVRYAASLLRWMNHKQRPLSSLKPADIDAFLLSCRELGWSLATMGSFAASIRVFLRYAASRSWCRDGLCDAVRRPSGSRRYAVIDKGRPWTDVQHLVRSVQGKNMASIRARAALLLMSHYALRNSEMAALRVWDVDFRRMTLTVRRAKNGQLQRYPLSAAVAHAIRAYLDVRPKSADMLFLDTKAPFAPAGRKAFYHITNYRFAKIGITTGRRGPHAIRHSRATQLLRQDRPLREIADFLGHKRLDSSLTYAVHNVQSLREVADFSLAGLL